MKLVAKSLFLLVSLGAVLADAQSFQHIIVVFQENRTPDNLFQGLCGPSHKLCPTPYNLRNYGIDKTGKKVPLFRTPLGISYDLDHSHNGFLKMCDLDPATNTCRMDGLSTTGCPLGHCAYTFVDPADVGPYVSLAQQYGWANFMFQTNQGPTGPAHQFIFAGTSVATADDDAEALFISNNPDPNGSGGGCIAPLNESELVISPQSWPNEYEGYINNPLGSLCFSHPTMATLLDNHQPAISWKYYTEGPHTIATAPNWYRDICVPDSGYQECTGQEWNNNVDLWPPDVLNDIGNCRLRNMNWVIPDGKSSDHPGDPSFTGGPSWVASIVNAIGESSCKNPDGSSYWNSTAIFITWDDWGGFYDHEPPTLLSVPNQGQGDYQYGFRVPLVVVSAYTPLGYIDNARYDFGSILRFAEQNFGIPEGALNFADARATNDLTTFFNRNNPPRKFQHIAAPKAADYFLNDKSPPVPPDTY
jgi:phospholipase C